MNLPSYKIRESSRARHIRVRVTAKEGVTVVVPKGFNRKKIPGLLKKRHEWIRKAIDRIETHKLFFQQQVDKGLPEQIVLQAIDHIWMPVYRKTAEDIVCIRSQSKDRLIVRGNITDCEVVERALRRWLLRMAHQYLVPWLNEVSHATKLPYNRTFVKGQKTRWASCSKQKTISLNYKLLFLPRYLVRYVFIHELCHTVYLKHSPKFWALVGSLEPRYHQLDKALREGWKYVPQWANQASA